MIISSEIPAAWITFFMASGGIVSKSVTTATQVSASWSWKA
jgi:hypothetical protein